MKKVRFVATTTTFLNKPNTRDTQPSAIQAVSAV
jgi:hypothetical protein